MLVSMVSWWVELCLAKCGEVERGAALYGM